MDPDIEGVHARHYHDLKKENEQLRELLQEYYDQMSDYQENGFFHALDAERDALQRRARRWLKKTSGHS